MILMRNLDSFHKKPGENNTWKMGEVAYDDDHRLSLELNQVTYGDTLC